MALYQRSHAEQGSPAAGPVQSVEHAIGAPGAEGVRELTAAEATRAFEQLFAGLTDRIRNTEILARASVHGADGALRLRSVSPEIGSEISGEGAR